jgi:hypothetical protein
MNMWEWIVVILVGAWLFDYARKKAADAEYNQWARSHTEAREKAEEANRLKRETALQRGDYDLTCKHCSGLAHPIRGTYDRYACSCGCKFKGARHQF